MGADWLDLDIKNCSTERLVELHQQLDGGDHGPVQLEIRREMVDRLRKMAHWTNQQIVDWLVSGVPKGEKRKHIAKAYAEILGITEQEFKKMAGG